MAYYIRKSIRVGPFRFNLSKSGIGVSTGIRGLRVGSGPRGNYIHMGRGGLYYRKTLPSRSTSPGAHSESHDATPTCIPDSTHGPMEAISSGSIEQMADSSSATLLAELQQKRRQIRYWPSAAVISVLFLFALAGLAVAPWIIAVLALPMFLGVLVVHRRDIVNKSAVIMYDLDGEVAESFRCLHDAVASLENCGATWHVNARGDVYDAKYHAGAEHLVNRKRIKVAERDPPFVHTNVSVICLPCGNRTLYFLPDRILLFATNGIGSLSYGDLRLDLGSTRFIEEEHVPRDAKVVDRTWRYVNKDGAPDRRFNNNRELPICLYEEIRLHSSTGLNEILQVSRTGIGSELEKAVAAMASALASASLGSQQPHLSPDMAFPGKNDARAVQGQSVAPRQAPKKDVLYETLFNALCCVMVADSRASRSEKKRISDLMRKAGASWTSESIEQRISDFIDRVQKGEYSRVVSETIVRVPAFKQAGQQDMLLNCIDSVAGADGKLDPREQALCGRIRDAVA